MYSAIIEIKHRKELFVGANKVLFNPFKSIEFEQLTAYSTRWKTQAHTLITQFHFMSLFILHNGACTFLGYLIVLDCDVKSDHDLSYGLYMWLCVIKESKGSTTKLICCIVIFSNFYKSNYKES